MNKEQIFEELKEILHTVKPKVELDKITPESNLLCDLTIDSLSMLLLSLAVENKFGIQFETNVQFKTVADVVDYISGKI